MNNGFWTCGILSVLFFVIGLLFGICKAKAARFVSGFNSLPKEEQILYDKVHITRDVRNQCYAWSVIMLIGAVLSCYVTQYMAILAYIIWLFLFLKDVHIDAHKAFEKYLIK